ncbi:MAG: hypothetical protein IPG90_21615 [Bacteroidetes bacterium]|nr:hypothetical protein [Bacteroidota bacterium]
MDSDSGIIMKRRPVKGTGAWTYNTTSFGTPATHDSQARLATGGSNQQTVHALWCGGGNDTMPVSVKCTRFLFPFDGCRNYMAGHAVSCRSWMHFIIKDLVRVIIRLIAEETLLQLPMEIVKQILVYSNPQMAAIHGRKRL